MTAIRYLLISIAAYFLFQIGVANTILNGVGCKRNPLLPTADKFTDLLQIKTKILNAVDLDNYPNLESSIIKYNSYTSETRPKCCRPDQFPDLFTFLYDLFVAIESIGKEIGALLCDLLKLITPLSCKQKIKDNPNDSTSLGCLMKSLLGPLFGRLGALITDIITGLLGPFDVLNGCLITGVAQVVNYALNKKNDTEIGDAVGPIAVVSTILGVIFAILTCLGEPLTTAGHAAYMSAYKNIIEVCEKQVKQGLWRSGLKN